MNELIYLNTATDAARFMRHVADCLKQTGAEVGLLPQMLINKADHIDIVTKIPTKRSES